MSQNLENFIVWDYSYDKETFLLHLLKANNGILLIPDPNRLTKKDFSIIEKILKNEIIEFEKDVNILIDCTVWILAPIEQEKKKTGPKLK